MSPSEIYAVVRSQMAAVSEIPLPEVPAGHPPHEPKPYRDPSLLYLACPKEKWLECAKILKNDARLSFDFLLMVTAIDYPQTTAKEQARIDVVYHFFSTKFRHKLFVKVSLPRENPKINSVIEFWPTADWQEREVYDMFGVKFTNHPNCNRILMWENFPGWPLRKDYKHIPDRYDD